MTRPLAGGAVVLGVYAGPHGLAGAIVRDGAITAAVQLERLIGVKHAWAGPKRRNRDFVFDRIRHDFQDAPLYLDDTLPLILDYLYRAAGISRADVDVVALEAQSIFNCELDAEPDDDDELADAFDDLPIVRVEHHAGHRAQAFYPSPFRQAAVVSVDGRSWGTAPALGTPESTTVAVGTDSALTTLYESNAALVGEYYDVSLRLFGERYAEGKTMGLAPYGDPARLPDDGMLASWLESAQRYHRPGWLRVTGPLARAELASTRVPLGLAGFPGLAPIRAGVPPTPAQQQVAYLCQVAYESDLLRLLTAVRRETGLTDLAIAGGAALNCVANGKILAGSGFDRLYVYPNPGDEGLAAGLALAAYHALAAEPLRRELRSDALGRCYSREEITASLDLAAGSVTATDHAGEIYDVTAGMLADGAVVAWFQGRSEFGPRALGHRSLLGHPGVPGMRDRMNNRVKRREPWRPFAPSVLAERAAEFFEICGESPFMLLAVPVRAEYRDALPAITHCDGTARVQTVAAADEPEYHRLISAFAARTGLPVLLDTSLNLRGQPIAETPDQALACLAETDIDALVMDSFLIRRS